MTLSLAETIPPGVLEPFRATVARWTEVPEGTTWDPEPSYGAFVDEQGRIVSGASPPRAYLASGDPQSLEFFEPPSWEGPVTTVFLDWGRQPLSWERIFELWDAWESQGMVVDCGSVAVGWSEAHRWISPGWVAFRGAFDGSPLTTQVRPASPAAEPPEPAEDQGSQRVSLLARARILRGESAPEPDAGEPLPMLPFTLASLEDPGHRWPQGVA